jgi:streptomycin 6-kinase
VRFIIEVVRAGDGDRTEVLHRLTADEISPKRVKVRAEQLFQFWRGRGATSARVLNARGEELYIAQ